MGKFNLNNATDFARATNSFGGSILSLFTGRGESAWQLQEGAYKSGENPGISAVFHVFTSSQDFNGAVDRITDKGGRRKVKFEFPFLDGQLTEDQGRKAETFDVNILLFGGNYLEQFNFLFSLLHQSTPGTLVHPVRGEIRCGMEDYEILHEEKARKAIAIRLVLTEHSLGAFDLIAISEKNNASAPSKLAKLATAFKKIEDAINAVQGAANFVTSLKATIVDGLENISSTYGLVSGNMNATFNPNSNVPALLPTQLGGLTDGQGNVVSNATSIATAAADPFENLPPNLTTQNLQIALVIEQLQKDVVGVRQSLADQIELMETANNGLGSLEFFANIMDLRSMANDIQDAFEAGKQSSLVRIIKYVTPNDMSVREAAFNNGLLPDDGIQIAFLNPELDSLNLIPKGTEIKVAVAS